MKPVKKTSRVSAVTKLPSFGDLCEMSDGLAVVWRRNGCTEREMFEFINDEPFILCDVIPALHRLGFTEDEVVRYVPHDSTLARIALAASWFLAFPNKTRSSTLAVPPWILAAFLRRALTRRIATMRNKATRPVHYEAEKVRRRTMAAERRRITRRTTTNPCPSAEDLLNAWRHVRDSKENLVRFGSMIQDLECYVDNSLRFDQAGRIVGRNAGVKGWLREHAPELAEHYTSVIRYKAAAKKLRQIVGLADPTPVVTVLGEAQREADARDRTGRTRMEEECNYGAEKSNDEGSMSHDDARRQNTRADGMGGKDARIKETSRKDTRTKGTGKNGTGDSPPVAVVRARAVYLEVMEGVPDVAARVLARIDALCDPERTDEAATLRSWREKYENAITVRRKDLWWRRLTA